MRKKTEIPSKFEFLVSTDELSKFLNLSRRRIEQLTKTNVLRKNARGSYLLFQNLQGYFTYLRLLLRRYMSLYRIELERTNRRTHFQNLPFYEDVVTPAPEFAQEDLEALFTKRSAT